MRVLRVIISMRLSLHTAGLRIMYMVGQQTGLYVQLALPVIRLFDSEFVNVFLNGFGFGPRRRSNERPENHHPTAMSRMLVFIDGSGFICCLGLNNALC